MIEKKIITILKDKSEISIAGISDAVGVSKRSVQRKLKVMMTDGLVDRISNKTGRGNVQVYEIKGDKKGDKRVTEETWIDRFNSFCNKLLVTKDTKYLTERQIQFVKDEFKNKNIEYIVEEFCSYWEVANKPKTFVPYLRLRTWLRKAKEYERNEIRPTGQKTAKGRRLSDSSGNKFKDSKLNDLARRSQSIH